MKKLLLTALLGLCLSSNLISSEAAVSSSHSEGDEPPAKRARTGQVYGIATYDALFKYVLSEDSIRPSFFHAFVPDLTITSSQRLDEHMNPLQELQLLRDFIHRKDTEETVGRISSSPGVCLGLVDASPSSFVKDDDATTFLHEMVGHFEDIKKAFPRAKYDGTMDFVCKLDTGDYAMVEMQVIPQNYWDRRALAYVAAFYGNQLYKGDKWEQHIKKVIGINILGGGKDDKVHWGKTPDEYVRYYKFQEQLHEERGKRYIDGIELIQYSIMNAPEVAPTSDQEKQDWITFFKRGHRMSEEQVSEQIKTTAVLEAFNRATLSRLPASVRRSYDDEDHQFDIYSEYTEKFVADKVAKEVAEQLEKALEKGKEEGIKEGVKEGEVKGERKGLLIGARALKIMGTMTNAQIAAQLGGVLTEAEVADIKID